MQTTDEIIALMLEAGVQLGPKFDSMIRYLQAVDGNLDTKYQVAFREGFPGFILKISYVMEKLDIAVDIYYDVTQYDSTKLSFMMKNFVRTAYGTTNSSPNSFSEVWLIDPDHDYFNLRFKAYLEGQKGAINSNIRNKLSSDKVWVADRTKYLVGKEMAERDIDPKYTQYFIDLLKSMNIKLQATREMEFISVVYKLVSLYKIHHAV